MPTPASHKKREKRQSKPTNQPRPTRTDIANAARLVSLFGHEMRFCHPWKRWLIWDGKRWAADQTGAALQLAMRAAELMLEEAKQKDEHVAARVADRVGNLRRLEVMLELAAAELAILPEEFDRDPWLLNCDNGTLDLRTGELREHRPDEFITKLCPTPYRPDASAELWESFLHSVFRKPGIVEFLKIFLGYCLTGDVREQFLPIFWGQGSNGKSTLLEAFMHTLGRDYAMKAPADMLIVKKNESHPTERADLFGKRFVACIECDQARRLNESFVKELTGGDSIRARRLYENNWEFRPTHKVLLCTNLCPEVRGTDHAIWRRLALLQFPVTFWDADKGETGAADCRQDKTLPERLRQAADGILAWCVQGCLVWQQNRLQLPGDVIAATERYRRNEDIVEAFIEQCCKIDATCRIGAGRLYTAYQFWAIREGRRDIGSRMFGEAMCGKFERIKSNGNWYKGLDLVEGWDNVF